MILVAQSLGLGTCYVGNLHEFGNESPEIRELLAIPPEKDILIFLCWDILQSASVGWSGGKQPRFAGLIN
jgi:hypothetical protein